MNVKGFTACFGWRDRNCGIITCLNGIDFFFLPSVAEFKMEMREAAEAKWEGKKTQVCISTSIKTWKSGVGLSNLLKCIPLQSAVYFTPQKQKKHWSFRYFKEAPNPKTSIYSIYAASLRTKDAGSARGVSFSCQMAKKKKVSAHFSVIQHCFAGSFVNFAI